MNLYLRLRYDRKLPEDQFDILVADESPGEDWMVTRASAEAVAWFQKQEASGSDAFAMAKELVGMTFLAALERGQDDANEITGLMMASLVQTVTARPNLSPDDLAEQRRRDTDGHEE